MPIVRGKLSNTDAFKKLLSDVLVPSIFASVETGPNDEIICLDADRNKMMEFSDRPYGSGTPGHYRIYRSPNDFVDFAQCNLVVTDMDYIGCENGIIFTGQLATSNGYTYWAHFIIAKTNNDKPAFIGMNFINSSSPDYTQPFRHIAYGDNPSFDTTTPSVREVGTQTVLQAFATNANIGVKSVTPKAFMIVRDTAYALNFGTFTLDGVEYITDGYLAISTATD